MDGGHPQDYPGKSGVGEQFLFYTTSNVNNLFKKFVIIIHLSRFVIVTAEYNCSLPPALTNLFDYFPPASFRQCVFVFFSLFLSFLFVFCLCCCLFLNNLKQDMFIVQQEVSASAHLLLRHKLVSIAAYSMDPFFVSVIVFAFV